MELKLHGQFLLGVPYQGKLHHDFSVEILTLGGECTALEVIAGLGIDPESQHTADTMLVDLAYLAQQLHIKGIPRKALTPQFLLDNLATDDYVLVMTHIAQLRKKRQHVGEFPAPTESELQTMG